MKGGDRGDLYRNRLPTTKPKVSLYIVTETPAYSVASSALLIVRHYERQEGAGRKEAIGFIVMRRTPALWVARSSFCGALAVDRCIY
jgi:hypothetical protein